MPSQMSEPSELQQEKKKIKGNILSQCSVVVVVVLFVCLFVCLFVSVVVVVVVLSVCFNIHSYKSHKIHCQN